MPALITILMERLFEDVGVAITLVGAIRFTTHVGARPFS